jgi:4-hydroxybenzoyl-CoA reductase subunit beta
MTILPRFSYKLAQSVEEAIGLSEEYNGKVHYLAGGTDLIPLVKLRLASPELVVDLKGIEELKGIHHHDGRLSIGANVTLFDLKNEPLVKEYFNGLRESLDATSCETLQMRGTIGGNILQNTRCLFYNKSLEWRTARGFCLKMAGKTCNAVPNGQVCLSNYCSDNAVSLIALSAEAKLIGPDGERTVKFEHIFSGNGVAPFTIKRGEILTQILVPLEKSRSVYEKLRVRDSMDYPLVGVAVSLKGAGGRVCIAGVGPAPLVYDLKGTGADDLEEVAHVAYGHAKTISNAVLCPAYRKKMVGVLVKRAVRRALQEGE